MMREGYSLRRRRADRQLPRSIRADTPIKTPLPCRFGWHQMRWDHPYADRYWKQPGTCVRCGIMKDRLL